MAKAKNKKCIVVFDDQVGLCVPFGWDDECEGALCNAWPVVVFADRDAARRAIRVSMRFAELRKSQGKAANADFLAPALKNVKIVPVVEAE